MSTHILYLTSRCNLACRYCYEHRTEFKDFDLSLEDAKRNIDDILAQDPKPVIVLFGGEPTLRWGVCKEVMRYGYNANNKVYFSICTNGLKFRSSGMCQDFLEVRGQVNGQVSLDISFDGVGNYLRTFKTGKESTEYMYEVFRQLKRHRIPFNIRYTVHPETLELSKSDIPNIARYLRPERVILSFDGVQPTDLTLDAKVDIPVCELNCNTCKRCTKGENTLYWSHKGNVRTLKKGDNAGMFNDFEL